MFCSKLYSCVYWLFGCLVLWLVPSLACAKTLNFLKGDWGIYGLVLYQPTDIITIDTKMRQERFDARYNIGFGIKKDHFRAEYTTFMRAPRIEVAFDFWKNSFATPYVGYLYTTGTSLKDDGGGVQRSKVVRNDLVIGMSVNPIKFLSIYGEMDFGDKYFLAGMRFILPYKVK